MVFVEDGEVDMDGRLGGGGGRGGERLVTVSVGDSTGLVEEEIYRLRYLLVTRQG